MTTAPSPRAAPAPRRSWSFTIARIAGIDLRVHWSFLFLVALFWIAGTAPDGLGVVSSMVWLLVIFACVVVHELAHCLVGRTRGAVVHEIVLLPIGGVSKLEHLPESPGGEFAVAIAGPLASIGLAAGAGLAALAAQVPLIPVTLYDGPLLARTFWFNLVIAAFNLLPAFPLDGGRVFRALLERRYDLLRATHIAVRFGHAVAVTFVVVGLFFNLWLVVIGLFVYFGASAEEAATIVHVRLRGRRVRDLMLLEPVVVRGDATLAQVQPLLRRTAQRAFPVVGHDGYLGMIDVAAMERAEPDRTAADLADPSAPLIDPDDLVEDDLPPLVSARGALAVGRDGQVAGILRIEDVRHLVDKPEDPQGG